MSTSSLTTLGTTLAATCSTEPTGSTGRRHAGRDTAETSTSRPGGPAARAARLPRRRRRRRPQLPTLRQSKRLRANAFGDERAGWPGMGWGAPAVGVVGRAESANAADSAASRSASRTCCCWYGPGRCGPGYPGAPCSRPPGRPPGCWGGGEYLGWFVMSLQCSSSSRFRHSEQRRVHAHSAHLG